MRITIVVAGVGVLMTAVASLLVLVPAYIDVVLSVASAIAWCVWLENRPPGSEVRQQAASAVGRRDSRLESRRRKYRD